MKSSIEFSSHLTEREKTVGELALELDVDWRVVEKLIYFLEDTGFVVRFNSKIRLTESGKRIVEL